MDKLNALKIALTALAGGLTALWGWMGWLVVGWVALMVLDYITGTCAAVKNGSWSSKVAREGIWHKVGMVVVVIIALAADLLIGTVLAHLPVVSLPFEYTGLVCPLVLVWYCITELGSLAENAVLLGAPMPSFLKKVLSISQEVIDKTADAVTGNEK